VQRDIERIIDRVSAMRPNVAISQLQVSHEADDDGLWFFRRRDTVGEVQIESSSGDCPFLVESDFDDERQIANSVDEAVTLIVRLLDR